MKLKGHKKTYHQYFLNKFHDVVNFLVTPNNKPINELRTKDKIKDILILYIQKFILSILAVVLVRILISAENIEISILDFILIGVFVVPLIEEVIFRLPLVFKPFYLSISSCFSSLIIISKFYFHTGYLNFDNLFFIRLLIAIVIGIVMYLFTRKYTVLIERFWDIYFKWVYYGSIIMFGSLHITNFELTKENLLLLPFLTLPQLIAGIYTGYIRVKYGFIYTLIFHSMNNLISLLF